MQTIGSCSVHWQRGTGRGEYEAVPGHSMNGKRAILVVPELDVRMDAEVIGTVSQGKYRLRKEGDGNDRSKLHLVPLVMALARFPDPRRQDTLNGVTWPLTHKGYIVQEMDFDIVSFEDEPDDWTEDEDEGAAHQDIVYLYPRKARILHAPAEREIDLSARFRALREEREYVDGLEGADDDLAEAIRDHLAAIGAERNTSRAKDAAARAIALLEGAYGAANLATLLEIQQMPPAPFEAVGPGGIEPAAEAPAGLQPAVEPAPAPFVADGIVGIEGRVLTRMHSYKERRPDFVRDAKQWHAAMSGGILRCECCACNPAERYGERGLNRMEAHHRVPVEELLPNTPVRPEDLSMVCPSCHDIIHAKRPWLSVEEVRKLVQDGPHPY